MHHGRNHPPLPSSFTLSTQTLTTAQANAITDYTNLRLEFTASCASTCSTTVTKTDSVSVSWAEFEVPNAIPSQVTGFTATAISTSQINLSWTAPYNGGSTITGYKIERESPVGGGFSTIVANTGSTSTTYSSVGLADNAQYNYRVSAINAIGTGTASAPANATTPIIQTIPSQVTGFTATAISTSQINLSWTAPYNGGSTITGYKIERESPVGGVFSTIVANTGSTSTTYSSVGLADNAQYNYRVSAINAIGTGTASNESASSTFTLIPSDTTSPIVTVPADMTVDASSESGSVVVFTSSANDETDGNVSVSCSPTSGSTFPQGITIISCVASDTSGNVGTKSFTITVSPYILPVLETTAHLTLSNSEVTIPTDAVISTVLVDSNIDSKIIFSPAVSNQVTTPNTNLEISITESSGSTITISFQPQTTISGQQFLGIMNLPDGIISSNCPTNIKKDDETLQSCIEIGKKGERLSVSNPVRIVLPDQGDYIPYYAVNDNEERTIITTQCIADNPTSTSEQIGGTGQPDTCYIKVGSDMVIWSSHFTSFGTITSSSQSVQSDSSSKSTRPPPQINGIGLFKILTKSDQGNMTDSQKFEDYFPYSMQSYVSDSLNYGERFVKIGQFFPLEGYSTEILPVIAVKGDHVQFQIRLYDQYKGFNIEHVALYFTDMESTDIKKLDTFVSYEKGSQVKISDPQGIFGNVKVVASPEFDAYWAIFDIQFAKSISSNDILIETWNESHFPAYAKTENAIEVNDPVLKQFGDNPILKTVEIHIPVIHTSPQCALKKACFDPSESTVLKGGIVSWVNKDASFVHAITSGKPESGPDNRFNGFLRPASTYEFQFNQIGEYPYYCAIHPWSTGMIHVVDKDTQSSFDKTKDVISGSNISGKITIPELVKVPIKIESIESGINTSIEVGKTISLKTKNLSVEISGNVGKNPKYPDVQITIIHPDDSEDKFNVKLNDRGEYFIPTKLNSKWESGNYEVIATYNNVQIGNIPFKIKSTDEQGFGGILDTTPVKIMRAIDQFEQGLITKKSLQSNLENLDLDEKEINAIFFKIGIDPSEMIMSKPVQNNENSWQFYLILLIVPAVLVVPFYKMRKDHIKH
ncbi:titin [Nitrosarchaeum sp.]|nr:titin [Nitrosarchaeum sp.]